MTLTLSDIDPTRGRGVSASLILGPVTASSCGARGIQQSQSAKGQCALNPVWRSQRRTPSSLPPAVDADVQAPELATATK